MERVGLYFGSFNPIHNGHIAVCRYVLENNLCDELRIIVSAQNPFKDESTLAKEEHRLEMTKLAVKNANLGDRLKISDIELRLPKPSWTINTLRELKRTEVNTKFYIVMGEDNLNTIHLWKESEEVQKIAKIIAYPRECSNLSGINNNDLLEQAPLLNFTSTSIRNAIINSEKINGMVCKSVEEYIKKEGLYERF